MINPRTAGALGIVTAVGLAALSWTTDGFEVVTAEAARQRAVTFTPEPVPVFDLSDHTGQITRWPDTFTSDGRISIVTFVYTRCQSICSVLNAQYWQMQRELIESGLDKKIKLVTVTFDPQRDTQAAIATHAKSLGVEASVWRFVRPESDAQLQVVLKQFGIVTVPDGVGEFQHNAAWHIVDKQGRLARIVPVEEPGLAIATAVMLAGATRP